MELTRAIGARHMIRDLAPDALEPGLVADLCDRARHAPSAGHSQGTELILLEGEAETARHWEASLAGDRRDSFAWPGLVSAPALVVVTADPGAYAARYREQDKAGTGLGAGTEAWPVPYWFVDAGMVVQNLLLLATGTGLGACFFGHFAHERAVLAALGVPDDRRGVGTVALGRPATSGAVGGASGETTTGSGRPGRSAARGWRPRNQVVHRGGWQPG